MSTIIKSTSANWPSHIHRGVFTFYELGKSKPGFKFQQRPCYIFFVNSLHQKKKGTRTTSLPSFTGPLILLLQEGAMT